MLNPEFFEQTTAQLRKVRDNAAHTPATRMAARLEILNRIAKGNC